MKCEVPECDSGWRTGPGEWGKRIYRWLVFSLSDPKLTGVKGGLKWKVFFFFFSCHLGGFEAQASPCLGF